MGGPDGESFVKQLSAAIAAAVFLATPAIAQKTPVPPLLKQALSEPASSQLYAYDFENVNENTNSEEASRQTIRGRIDPSRKKGDRVTITFLEDTGKKPAEMKKLDERYERGADGDIFCDSTSSDAVTNVIDKGAAPGGGRLFAFTPRAETSAEGEMNEIYKKMTAEAVVDEATGVMRSFSGMLLKKHNVMLVADVKAAKIDVTCALLPEARSYTAQSRLNFDIAAFGNSFSIRSVQTISNVMPVR